MKIDGQEQVPDFRELFTTLQQVDLLILSAKNADYDDAFGKEGAQSGSHQFCRSTVLPLEPRFLQNATVQCQI